MDFGTFLLGVLSSLFATIIVFVFRSQFTNLVNMLFFKVFPKVAGKYRVVVHKERESFPDQKDTLRVSQFGAKI
jgi:hypothetical protein